MKSLCLIQGPFATRSGYGDMSRDIIRHVLSMNEYDVILNSMPWGACPMNSLVQGRDDDIISRILVTPTLPKQPDLFIQISVPNEFFALGKFNIGITAGIETTICSPQWLDGMNKMDVIFTISEHSKTVLANTIVEERDRQTNQTIRKIKLEKPIEVLHNCINANIFKRIEFDKIPQSLEEQMTAIPESFNFLFVGHWLQGDIGEDRKNVGLMIKTFGDTFKNLNPSKRPGLILKTSSADFSLLDQIEILRKIRLIKNLVGPGCPNIYLLHGDLSEEEMNALYNHPKVKAHVNLTKGEGFCRPLLEATQSQRPIIASGWSGHLDFLNKDHAILIGGELRTVDKGAVWDGVILADAQWFNFDVKGASTAMKHVFNHPESCKENAKILSKTARIGFSYPVIEKKTHELIRQYVPKFAEYKPLTLPVKSKMPELVSVA